MTARPIRDSLFFAAGGAACAAAVMLSRSDVRQWAIIPGVLSVVLLGLFRTEIALYLLLLSGVYFTPLYPLSFRLSEVLILPSDVLALGALVLYLPFQAKPRVGDGGKGGGFRLAGIFVVLILLATLQGVLKGNYWKSVFRETKMVLYYGAVPVFASLLDSGKLRLRPLLLWVLLLATAGSLYDIYCRVFDVYTVSAYAGGIEGEVTYAYTPLGAIVRDYGWVSTFHYQVFAFLCATVFFLNAGNWRVRILYLLLAAVNLGANLLTVTRGFVLSLLLGSITLVVFEGAKKGVRLTVLLPRILLVLSLVIGLMLLVVRVVPQAKWAFYRTLSLLVPEYAGRGDVENAGVRLAAIQLGARAALQHPLGMGLGIASRTGEESLGERSVLSLLYHNSLGYILYTFGLVGGAVVLGALAWAFLGLIRSFRQTTGEDRTLLTVVAASFIALLAMSFTSGNFLFTVGNVLPLAILLFSAIRSYRTGTVRSVPGSE